MVATFEPVFDDGMVAVQLDVSAYEQLCGNADIGNLLQAEDQYPDPLPGFGSRSFECTLDLQPGDSHVLTYRLVFPMLDKTGGQTEIHVLTTIEQTGTT